MKLFLTCFLLIFSFFCFGQFNSKSIFGVGHQLISNKNVEVVHLESDIKILDVPIRSYVKVAIVDDNGYFKLVEVMKVVISQKFTWEVYNPNKISYDKRGWGGSTSMGGSAKEKWLDYEWYYQDLAGNRVKDVYIIIKHPN